MPIKSLQSSLLYDSQIRNGNVADPKSTDSRVKGVQATFELLGQLEKEGYLESTALQTVGVSPSHLSLSRLDSRQDKGYDGFTYSIVSKPKPRVV